MHGAHRGSYSIARRIFARLNYDKICLPCNNYSQQMQSQGYNQLQLSYQQFERHGKSIADTRIDKYIVYERLGWGAFGSVYKGMDDVTKKQVAIKVLDLAEIEKVESNKNVREIRKRLAKTESELMSKIDSQHVMKIYQVYENKHLKIMVVEYCNGGTLAQQIIRGRGISQADAIEIIKQVIKGISDMHKINIIHRDLKTENIMSHNGIYKIVDLGFAKMIPPGSEAFNTTLGTIITMAPEVLKKQRYGLKADIWSIGVIFYQMIYKKLPYEPMKHKEMVDQIYSKNIFGNNGKVDGIKPSPEVLNLLKKMLCIDPAQRISWNQLVSQDIFKSKMKMSDQYRVTINIENLITMEPEAREEQEIINSLKNEMQDERQPQRKVTVQKLSEEEKINKKQEINSSDVEIVKWAIANHLQCLKTEFIYREMITSIEEKKVFNFKDRNVVQMMFLFSTRCFFNMSFVRNKFGNKSDPVIENLKLTVEILYKRVEEKFNFYSEKLSQIEGKVSSIIGDRLLKTFKKTEIDLKDKFLVGIENVNYTKEEQIQFTFERYIKQLVPNMKLKDEDLAAKLYCYAQINNITIEHLNNIRFSEVVAGIIRKRVNGY